MPLIGAHGFYRGSGKGPVDDENSGSGSSGLSLYGKAFTEYISLSAEAGFENQYTHFYGYPAGTEVDADDIRQSYNVFSLKGDISNTRNSTFAYKLGAAFSYLADRYEARESEECEVGNIFCQPSALASNVSLAVTRDTKNHPVFPTAGTRQNMTLEQTGGPLGGNGNFQKLASDAGNWSHTLQMWQAPGAEPMETTATSVRRMDLGGRYLTEDFTGTVMGMPFEGRAVMGYDNARQKYFSTWIDNMGTGLMVAWGEPVEGSNTIEFHGTYVDPMTGQEAPFREVHTDLEEGHTVMEMYMVGPDGSEFKSMEIHSMKQDG